MSKANSVQIRCLRMLHLLEGAGPQGLKVASLAVELGVSEGQIERDAQVIAEYVRAETFRRDGTRALRLIFDASGHKQFLPAADDSGSEG